MAATVEAKVVTVVMEFAKETPGTHQFKETPEPGQPAKIGTQYVPKATLAAIGNPTRIRVTIEPA